MAKKRKKLRKKLRKKQKKEEDSLLICLKKNALLYLKEGRFFMPSLELVVP